MKQIEVFLFGTVGRRSYVAIEKTRGEFDRHIRKLNFGELSLVNTFILLGVGAPVGKVDIDGVLLEAACELVVRQRFGPSDEWID